MKNKISVVSKNNEFFLRNISKKDLSFLMKLRNSPDTAEHLGDNRKVTIESQKNWYKKIEVASDCQYYIFEMKGLKEKPVEKIGMVRITGIDFLNRSMCVGGDIQVEYRGRGYSKIMFELIFKLGFNVLNFHKLWLLVLTNNQRAINLYKKVGFKENGRQRESVYRKKSGEYHDYIYMDILDREYN